ncbi:MAG: hypothetical protein M1836_000941 [Candelina mexicana]|nr:MAG: hypothetical protein M1836_000941 [Candelina mexicana]
MPKSKGKRSKKRKRAEGKAEAASDRHSKEAPYLGEPLPPNEPLPPPPELLSNLTIGLNDTTRRLEALSLQSLPKAYPASLQPSNTAAPPSKPTPHFVAIFVPRDEQPSLLHAHLPTLTVTASFANPNLPQTRLVGLPKGAESRMATALGLPRVGFVGLMEHAPHASALVNFVREHVPVVEAAWLDEVKAGVYLPVNITARNTSAPVKSKKPNEKGEETKKGKST